MKIKFIDKKEIMVKFKRYAVFLDWKHIGILDSFPSPSEIVLWWDIRSVAAWYYFKKTSFYIWLYKRFGLPR